MYKVLVFDICDLSRGEKKEEAEAVRVTQKYEACLTTDMENNFTFRSKKRLLLHVSKSRNVQEMDVYHQSWHGISL